MTSHLRGITCAIGKKNTILAWFFFSGSAKPPVWKEWNWKFALKECTSLEAPPVAERKIDLMTYEYFMILGCCCCFFKFILLQRKFYNGQLLNSKVLTELFLIVYMGEMWPLWLHSSHWSPGATGALPANANWWLWLSMGSG